MTAPVDGRPHAGVPRLERLNALRGPAALLVVLYHVRQIAVRDLGNAGAFELWRFGHAGVDLFFVISGFVIYFVHRGDLGARGAAPRFLTRRVVRVYPPLWIVTSLVLIAALAVPGSVHAQKLDAWFVARSYLLIPIHTALPLLPPAWTLSHEMKFYLIFATAVALPGRLWRPLVVTALVGSAVVTALQVGGLAIPFPLDFLLSPYNLEFAAGVGAAVLVLRARVPLSRVVAIAGVMLWIFGAAHDAPVGSPDAAQVVRFGLGSAVIVLGVAARDLEHRAFHAPVLQLLGNASYAIYLVHLPVIIGGIRIVRHANARPALLPLSLVALLAVVIGVVFHVAVERPMTRALNSLLLRRPTVPRAAAQTG